MIFITCLGLSFGKVGVLAEMLGFQLSFKGLIRGFWVDGLLFQDGEDAHGLLKELETGSEIHSEVTGDPDNSLSHVLLLLQHEHGVVEELKDRFIKSQFISLIMFTCCSFSLTRLIQICSKVLNSKISKPAISSTPMKVTFFMVGS